MYILFSTQFSSGFLAIFVFLPLVLRKIFLKVRQNQNHLCRHDPCLLHGVISGRTKLTKNVDICWWCWSNSVTWSPDSPMINHHLSRTNTGTTATTTSSYLVNLLNSRCHKIPRQRSGPTCEKISATDKLFYSYQHTASCMASPQ